MRAAILALLLAGAAGCATQNPYAETQAQIDYALQETTCTVVAPHYDYPRPGFEGVEYEAGVWYDVEGNVVGYAVVEDDVVWSSLDCAQKNSQDPVDRTPRFLIH